MSVWSKSCALGAVLATLILGGCEDPVGEPQPPSSVEAGQQAEGLLGAAGGSIALTTGEGAVFSLQLPAGALDGDTTIRIETAPITGAQRFHLRLLPAGLILGGGERATLRIELPEALTLEEDAILIYDGAPVAFTRNADGSLDVELANFAPAPSTGAAISSARVAAPLAMAAATEEPACGGVPQLGGFMRGGLTNAEQAGAAAYGQCMVGAVRALARSGAYEDAMNLANATAAYLQSVGEGDPGGFIAQADAIACTAYRATLDLAKATTVTSMGQLVDLIRPVLFWEMAFQLRGGTCAQVPLNEYLTVVQEKSAQAAATYWERKPDLASVESPAYAEAVAEVREHENTLRQLQSLQASPALYSAARFAIEEVAQASLVNAMLEAPWRRCRENGQYDRLIELMRLTGGPGVIRRAGRTCGAQVMAWSLDPAGTTETGRLSFPLGGVDPETERLEGTMTVRPDGQLRILGPIRALQCPAGVAVGNERIEIRINDQLVEVLSGNVVGEPAISLSMPTLLATAGIPSGDFQSATLTVTREGDACAGYWGGLPQTLASITLLATSATSTTRFDGGGSYRSYCGFTHADRDWDSGMTVWLTRLLDGTHRIVAISPWSEAVSGFAEFLAIADRNDPEIENRPYQFTPIGATAGGGETQYTANWVDASGNPVTKALTFTVRADGTATMRFTGTFTSACSEGGQASPTTYTFTFDGARVP